MDKSNYLEETAIEYAKSGKEKGYRFLLEKYQRYAFSIAISIVKSEENAEEVDQDSFIRVFKNIEKFKKTGKFSTWLYRIVYNTSLTRLRKKQEIDAQSFDELENYEFDIPDTYTNGFDNLVRKDKISVVTKAVAKLSETENLVVTLYYLNECSIHEIGQITGWNTSTIKTRLFRARQNLYVEISKILKHEKKHM